MRDWCCGLVDKVTTVSAGLLPVQLPAAAWEKQQLAQVPRPMPSTCETQTKLPALIRPRDVLCSHLQIEPERRLLLTFEINKCISKKESQLRMAP